MHIAIVIERFQPSAGGNEKSTAQIVEELLKRGHRVTVITGMMRDADHPAGVEVIVMGRRRLKSAWQVWRFSTWAHRQLDQLEHDVSLSVTMAVAADVIQPRGGTVRETLERNVAMRSSIVARWGKRALLALSPKQRWLLTIERKHLADPRVKRIVAVSDYVVRQLQTHYQVADERITMIPNAATMPEADDAQRAAWRRDIRSAFDLSDEATVYLFAATNPRLKGMDSLVAAMTQLVDRKLNPIVLLAGALSYGLQQQVVKAGLRDHFRFVGPTQHMPALYAASDVTVLPTFYDPSSKVVLESLMMEVPAISTAFNGASDFIEPTDQPARGRVIADPADASALADAMAQLADPMTRQACAKATQGLASLLSMARHVEALERVLIEVKRSGAK